MNLYLFLQEQILKRAHWLTPESVTLEASLTRDLQLTSLHLAELLQASAERFGEVNLLPWLLSHASAGQDTLGSLIEYLEGTAAAVPAPRETNTAPPRHT